MKAVRLYYIKGYILFEEENVQYGKQSYFPQFDQNVQCACHKKFSDILFGIEQLHFKAHLKE